MKNQFNLYDEEPTISSDLEWMLKSRQVEDEVLIDALLADYYQPVHQLARSYFEDDEIAVEVTKQVFVNAYLEVESYSEGLGVEKWLFGIVKRTILGARTSPRFWKYVLVNSKEHGNKESGLSGARPGVRERHIWMAFNRLEREARLAVIAYSLLGWETDRIVDDFSLQRDRVQDWLHHWVRKDLIVFEEVNGVEQQELEEQISKAFLERWPSSDFHDQKKKSIRQIVIAASRRRQKFLWGVRSIKEIGILAALLVITLGVIWVQLPWDQDSQAYPNPVENTALTSSSNDLSSAVDAPNPESSTQPSATHTPVQAPIIEGKTSFTPTPEGVFYSVKFGDSLDSIAGELNVDVEELRRVNRIPAGEDLDLREFLLIPGTAPTPSPVTTASVSSGPDLAPLERSATSDEIARFILEGNWAIDTFWLDALAVVSGFEGSQSDSQPRPYRIQLWMSPDRVLILGGSAVGGPEQVVMRVDQDVYAAMPGEGQPWFENIYEGSGGSRLDYRYMAVFQLMFPFDLDSPQELVLRIAGEEIVAGRETWVVERVGDDGERTSMLWVDKNRGSVLRFKVTEPRGVPDGLISDVRVREIVVMEIGYDVNFPSELFHPEIPWVGGFAVNHTGKPVPPNQIQKSWSVLGGGDQFEAKLPPPEFDPSQAEISFRFPLSYSLATYFGGTDIFADGYYLGQVDIGIPWNLSCRRSPDGRLIAFLDPWSNEPGGDSLSYSGPYWFSLHDPQQIHEPLPSAVRVSSNFAFSPDSRYLAFWGCTSNLDNCGVYLHDTKTLKNRRLLKLSHGATYFVWSPEGDRLAMLGANDSFFIVRVEDGEIVYKGPFERQVKSVPPDAPVYRWGSEFPPDMGGLESCSLPNSE